VWISGRLLSNQDTTPFDNVAWVNYLVPEFDVTNNTGTATTRVQRRDVDFIITPSVQYAIS